MSRVVVATVCGRSPLTVACSFVFPSNTTENGPALSIFRGKNCRWPPRRSIGTAACSMPGLLVDCGNSGPLDSRRRGRSGQLLLCMVGTDENPAISARRDGLLISRWWRSSFLVWRWWCWRTATRRSGVQSLRLRSPGLNSVSMNIRLSEITHLPAFRSPGGPIRPHFHLVQDRLYAL